MATIKKKKSNFFRLIKYTSIIIGFLLIALISASFIFKDKIINKLVSNLNKSINATLSYKDADISLIKNFPKLRLEIEGLSIINKEPFLGDTLFYSDKIFATMKITTLFQSEEKPIEIQSIATENGQINILFDEKNQNNYDIFISKTSENTTESEPISLNINKYQLENIQFLYNDKLSKNKVILKNIYHSGKGNFSNDIFVLDTKSKTKFSIFINDTNYLKDVALTLDANLEIDLKNSRYTFKENTGFINQLPLEFDGFLQLLDESQFYDLNFKTPTSSFENAIALFPESSRGNLKDIQTKGNFDVKGVVKGSLSETTIPTFNIAIATENAQFKYVSLPKAVENITINATIDNQTGFAKDTYIDLKNASFTIDKDVFSASGKVSNFGENALVSLFANGRINLGNLSKVYPIAIENELSGLMQASLNSSFTIDVIQKKKYQLIKNSGEISVTNFKYQEKNETPFFIDKTLLSFSPSNIKLKEFNAKTGTSDFSIQGNIENFYAFIFDKKELKGKFSMTSDNLKVADFVSESKENETENQSPIKIPSFLNIEVSGTAKTVVYDNLVLKNVSANLFINDESIRLENFKTAIFGGNIGLSGTVSTKEKTPNFNMNLDLKQLNITESFSQVELLKAIAPIADILDGKMNADIKLAGNLDAGLSPILKSLSGNLFGQLINTKLIKGNSKVMSLLDSNLNFMDISKINLNNLSALLSFKDGNVEVKPFQIQAQDIKVQVSGSHSFDNSMDYNLLFDVPVSLLGNDVSKALSQLTPKDAASIKSVPVNAKLTGSFLSPNFSSDFSQTTKNLVASIAEKQKENFINKGKDNIIDLLENKNKEQDSTKTTENTTQKEVTKKVNSVLKNLFGKKKDSIKNN